MRMPRIFVSGVTIGGRSTTETWREDAPLHVRPSGVQIEKTQLTRDPHFRGGFAIGCAAGS